jgi:hypothetical protein
MARNDSVRGYVDLTLNCSTPKIVRGEGCLVSTTLGYRLIVEVELRRILL